MKRISFLAATILILSLAHANTPWTEGQVLNVFATSGLKLRAFPNLNSEVIDIVRFGDQVTVLNTFQFSEQKSDRIDWIDGHWILVEFDGLAGYLFDGYLSPLPFPSTEEEICNDGYSYAFTLSEFLEENYQLVEILDSSQQRQSLIYEGGIRLKKWHTDDHQKIEIEMPDTKINEVLNLLRTMAPSRAARSQFEKSLLFIEGMNGKVEKINIKLGDPVTLQVKENGHLLVKASGYAGC